VTSPDVTLVGASDRLKLLKAYLDWWEANGLDPIVAEASTNWFQLSASLQSAQPTQGLAPPEPQSANAVGSGGARSNTISSAPRAEPREATALPPIPLAPDAAVMAARELARSATSLEELRSLLENFEGCGLKATAKSLCLYRGAAKARLMIIGEAPGRDEDLQGKPFVGRAGQLLDKMLAAIGLTEADVHITNVVYWRPPGNRTPTTEEVQVCRPFLEKQIELVEPNVIALLGGVSAKHMLGLADGITKLRGKWRVLDVGAMRLRAIASLHPAYLLRTPAAKRQAWQDWLMVEEALEKEVANGQSS
jgi:uracil-DNA glycosylase